jgi:hypothetical protein
LFNLKIVKCWFCNKFLPVIKPQFHKALNKFPTSVFPKKAPREHWISSNTVPVPFFSLSPTQNSGTTAVQLQSRHRIITKLELFLSNSVALLQTYKNLRKILSGNSAELTPREHQIGIGTLKLSNFSVMFVPPLFPFLWSKSGEYYQTYRY